MKKVMKAVAALMLMAVVCAAGCTKPDEPGNGGNEPLIVLPQVTTTDVTDISTTSATVGGEIVSNGGGNIIECGVCWGIEAEPTINDNFVSLQVISDSYIISLDSLSSNTNYAVRAYAKNEVGIGYGNVVNFTTLENGGGFNDHEYVDLGLPSGLLWATCNVGADSPEDYGDYFAWGETQPKDCYMWSNYQYCTGGNYNYPYYNMFTKYCTNSLYGYEGFTDTLTVLQLDDDAANWGNGWRMPTKAEWNELIQSTTNNYTTRNGTRGCLFVATNGNELFLPAAGYYYDDVFYDGDNSLGHYWSSSLYADHPGYATLIAFRVNISVLDTEGDLHRYMGNSVRPVRSAK